MKLYYLRESANIDKVLDVGKTVFPAPILDRVMKKKGKARLRSALGYLMLGYCLKKENKGEIF